MFVLAGGANAAVPGERGPDGLVQRILKVITGYQTLRYPGAEFVKLHFARVDGPVTVSTVDGSESHRVDRPGWAMSISADTVVVHGSGVVDRVARSAPAGQRSSPRRHRQPESVCGPDEKVDAVCYRTTDPVPYRNTKAVARMLINGVELCTGFRIGPGNRMMTNHHCVGTLEEAADTEVWFNYQCAECGGYAVFSTAKVWLSEVLASDRTLDYTIFTVSSFASIEKFGYLELDVRRPARGEQLYVPQHPAGRPAAIAMGNCSVADSYYEGYAPDTDIAYYCDTEGGSSGSPVLSRGTDRVVALHHFGGCPNSGVRMDRLYPQIQHLV